MYHYKTAISVAAFLWWLRLTFNSQAHKQFSSTSRYFGELCLYIKSFANDIHHIENAAIAPFFFVLSVH